MSARISKISLIVFALLLVMSGFLLALPGDYWPWYTVMSAFAAVPLAAGPNRYRLMGALALALSVVLIVTDKAAGKNFRALHPGVERRR